MQDIATKLARIANAVKAAGLTSDQARHLIHGCGGSPRRARRAIRLGVHQQLIDTYSAALLEGGSHATATNRCNALAIELLGINRGGTPSDDSDDTDTDDHGAADDKLLAALAAPAPAPKRSRPARTAAPATTGKAASAAIAKARRVAAPDPDALRALLPA